MKLTVVILAVAACAASCSPRQSGDEGSTRTAVASGSADRDSAPEPSPGVRIDALEPYFRSPGDLAAQQAFEAQNWRLARDAFDRQLADDGRDRSLDPQRVLMKALCDVRLREWKSAAETFEELLETWPELEAYLRQQLARSWLFARDLDRALEFARSVDPTSAYGAEAQLLVGDILRQRGEHEASREAYLHFLEEHPRERRRAEARYRLAETCAALGRSLEAVEHLRTILTHAPFSQWQKHAQKRLQSLRGKLPGKQWREAIRTTAKQLIATAHVHYDLMRNEKSEKLFREALSAPDIDDDLRCEAAYYRANSVFRQRDRKRAAPLFDEALELCKRSSQKDLTAKSAFQAGRCYTNIGEYELAIPRYAAVEELQADHSYADDSIVRRAEVYQELDDLAKVEELLASVPAKFPEGDMGPEAMWRLGWQSYKAGRYKDAIRWLEKQIELAPVDDRFWAEGQAQYWIARAFGRLGKSKDAIGFYRKAIELYPLSYYALLSLNRLREDEPEAFAEVAKQIAEPETSQTSDADAFLLRDPELLRSPGFLRALAFLRLGLRNSAEVELEHLGFRAPPHRNRLTRPADIEKVWAGAYLDHLAGRHGQALWVTRWHVLDYKRHWPVGPWRKRWEIAYPPGYWDLLDNRARQNSLPTELLIAFVREESGFDPHRESFANAIGLTQMLVSTARNHSTGVSRRIDRQSLRDPEINATIGSRFLAHLMSRWGGQLSLVVPSYNAGAGAVSKWVGERGDLDVDAFIEEIPFDETRGYSKRVLSSYFAYSFLASGSIPVLANRFQHAPAGTP